MKLGTIKAHIITVPMCGDSASSAVHALIHSSWGVSCSKGCIEISAWQ